MNPVTSPATAATGPAAGPRLLFIDWLRIIALGWLVIYHVGMYYVSWPWHVKSSHAGPLIEPAMLLTSPWRMTLLFIVSGAATALMLERRAADAAWLRERAGRLLLPLLLGMLLIVPPQSYFEVVQHHGFRGSFVDFMALYLSGHGGFCSATRGCLVLPTWNHLWFLPYLFVYTWILWALLQRWPTLLERGATAFARALAGARLLWLPVAVLALERVLIGRHFPITHALFDDPHAHAMYGLAFAFGALAARQAALWQRIESLRWPALLAALAGWALLLALRDAPWPLRTAAVSVESWGALLAAFGFAHRHLQRDSALRRTLTEAVFPVYLLHQTVIVVLAVALAGFGLAPVIEGPLLMLATFAAGFAGYAVARRVPVLRPWMGLKREPPAAAAPPLRATAPPASS